MPSALPQLQKAYLEVETGTRIECMFNPATFAFSQANRWESDSVPGKSTLKMRYVGGQGGSFSLSLVFDTTAAGTAVSLHTGKLLKHFDIPTPITSYFEHNKLDKLEIILEALITGDVALVSVVAAGLAAGGAGGGAAAAPVSSSYSFLSSLRHSRYWSSAVPVRRSVCPSTSTTCGATSA